MAPACSSTCCCGCAAPAPPPRTSCEATAGPSTTVRGAGTARRGRAGRAGLSRHRAAAEAGAPRVPRSLPAADLLERTAEELARLGLSCECLGGGRLSHRPDERKIHVYGYSVVSEPGEPPLPCRGWER